MYTLTLRVANHWRILKFKNCFTLTLNLSLIEIKALIQFSIANAQRFRNKNSKLFDNKTFINLHNGNF